VFVQVYPQGKLESTLGLAITLRFQRVR